MLRLQMEFLIQGSTAYGCSHTAEKFRIQSLYYSCKYGVNDIITIAKGIPRQSHSICIWEPTYIVLARCMETPCCGSTLGFPGIDKPYIEVPWVLQYCGDPIPGYTHPNYRSPNTYTIFSLKLT